MLQVMITSIDILVSHFLANIYLRAYSFGNLNSRKSSENGRLSREKCQLPKESES